MRRKYPKSMFIMGAVLQLAKKWYLLVIAILLFVLRMFYPRISVILPLFVLIIWVIIAIVTQVKDVHTALNINSESYETNVSIDGMFVNNQEGYKGVTKTVTGIIEKYKTDSQQ